MQHDETICRARRRATHWTPLKAPATVLGPRRERDVGEGGRRSSSLTAVRPRERQAPPVGLNGSLLPNSGRPSPTSGLSAAGRFPASLHAHSLRTTHNRNAYHHSHHANPRRTAIYETPHSTRNSGHHRPAWETACAPTALAYSATRRPTTTPTITTPMAPFAPSRTTPTAQFFAQRDRNDQSRAILSCPAARPLSSLPHSPPPGSS